MRSSVSRPAGEFPSSVGMIVTSAVPPRRGPAGLPRCGHPRPGRAPAVDGSGSPERTSASNGESGPVPMPESSQLLEADTCGPFLCERIGAWIAELDRGGGDDERDQCGCRCRGRNPAVAHTRRAQAEQPRLALASRRFGGQSSLGPIVARTTGSSVIAMAKLTSAISRPAMPMLRRDGDRHREQREQRDRHGRAAEDDGGTGVLHRVSHRSLVRRCSAAAVPRASGR